MLRRAKLLASNRGLTCEVCQTPARLLHEYGSPVWKERKEDPEARVLACEACASVLDALPEATGFSEVKGSRVEKSA